MQMFPLWKMKCSLRVPDYNLKVFRQIVNHITVSHKSIQEYVLNCWHAFLPRNSRSWEHSNMSNLSRVVAISKSRQLKLISLSSARYLKMNIRYWYE